MANAPDFTSAARLSESGEYILMYLDSDNLWRWTHLKHGRSVRRSKPEGFTNKQHCVKSMERSLRGVLEKRFSTRLTPNAKWYQTGVLVSWDRDHTIHVEITPWPRKGPA